MNSSQFTEEKIMEIAKELRKLTGQVFIDPTKLEFTKHLLKKPQQPLVLI